MWMPTHAAVATSSVSPTPRMDSHAKISCQCGTVSLEAPHPNPMTVYVCHCLECRKQSASAFGISVLFPTESIWPLPPQLEDNVGVWTRPSDAGNSIECYFCKTCGVRLFHRCILPDGRVRPTLTVKGGTIEGFTLGEATHIWTRSALVPVPEGSFPREPSE